MTTKTLARILDPRTPDSIFWIAKNWHHDGQLPDLCADVNLLRGLFRAQKKLRWIPVAMSVVAAATFLLTVYFQSTKADLLMRGIVPYTYVALTIPLIVFLVWGAVYVSQQVGIIRRELAMSPHIVRLEAFFKDLSELSTRMDLEESDINNGMSVHGFSTMKGIAKDALVCMAVEVLILTPDEDATSDIRVRMDAEQTAKRVSFEHFFDLTKRFGLIPAKATYDEYYDAATKKIASTKTNATENQGAN